MSEPVLGEILMVSFNFPPAGYELCNGQLLNIADYSSLFALLGTTYGGDGTTTFGLPDLRGRVPVSASPTIAAGAKGGEELHVLAGEEMPKHSHPMFASSDVANEPNPTGNMIAAVDPAGEKLFREASAGADVNLGSVTVGTAGEAEGHNNMQPSLVINFCIAVTGTAPPPTAR